MTPEELKAIEARNAHDRRVTEALLPITGPGVPDDIAPLLAHINEQGARIGWYADALADETEAAGRLGDALLAREETIEQAFAMVCASDQALVAIRQVLGPGPGCGDNGCAGCTWEMNEAYRLSVGVVGPYVRKGKTAPTAGPGHDLAARVRELEAELSQLRAEMRDDYVERKMSKR